VIEIRNLQKISRSLKLIKGIDVTAPRDTLFPPNGSSGSGKSTNLHCVNLLGAAEIPGTTNRTDLILYL